MRRLFELLSHSAPDGRWFWGAFLGASESVVRCWGPSWAKWQAAGRPVGVWILIGVWLATPILCGALLVG